MNFGLQHLPFFLMLIGGLIFSVGKKKLTVIAGLTGALCGTLIYLGAGYEGFLMLTTFFLLGTLATGIGRRQKQRLEKTGDSVKRNSFQVLANAGMATLLAAFAIADPIHAGLYQILLATSIASATADTMASELGMVYGKKFYHCITFKKDSRGLDGVISLEGTLAGVIGAFIIALIHSFYRGFDSNFILIILAGAIGNYADSFIGATLERRKYLNNDAVNFVSTCVAVAFAAIFLFML